VGELEPSRTIEEDLLARAAEDWVHPAELLGVVRRKGIEDPELQRDLAVGLVARLLAQGLIVVGDVGTATFPGSVPREMRSCDWPASGLNVLISQ
jgi:hypothetical protein